MNTCRTLLIAALLSVLTLGCGGKSADPVEPAPAQGAPCPEVGTHVAAEMIAGLEKLVAESPDTYKMPPDDQKAQHRAKLEADVSAACTSGSWPADATRCLAEATIDTLEACYAMLDATQGARLRQLLDEGGKAMVGGAAAPAPQE